MKLHAKQLVIGQRFGKLVVLSAAPRNSPRNDLMWLCECECGAKRTVMGYHLRHGQTQSCGQKSCRRKKHGESLSRLYRVWSSMHTRCTNPNHSHYPLYGGRGIRVCAEWKNYMTFRDWALKNGYNDDVQIDRIDNNGNYEPTNCRYVTQKENVNRRPYLLAIRFIKLKRTLSSCLLAIDRVQWCYSTNKQEVKDAIIEAKRLIGESERAATHTER